MKEVHSQGIDYYINEPDLQNQKPVEGVIREVRYKWYRTMIKKRAPINIWDYGVNWVSEEMFITH